MAGASVSPEEIRNEMDKAYDAEATGCPFPGMTYSQGVSAALSWVLAESEDAPMDE